MKETLPKNMIINHRIPVVYKMRGFAEVKLPISASKSDIEDALEKVDPSEMQDADIYEDPYGGWEETWKPEISDNLSLLQMVGEAFVELEKQNIAPVANWCCNSDSHCQGQELLEENSKYIGYVFIHDQNVETLMDEGECCIGYAARPYTSETPPTEDPNINIAKMVKAALGEAGLTVEWDGSVDTKLTVKE